MQEIIQQMPVLMTAAFMNICAGLYYSIGTQKLRFSWQRLLSGLFKAAVTVILFLGTAYCFEAVDLSSLGATPAFVMNSAITLYVSKALISLGKILGIHIAAK